MRFLKRLGITTVIIIIVFISYDQVIKQPDSILKRVSAESGRAEIHCKHFFFGYPYGTDQDNDLIIRDIYAISTNDDTKFADWVAYRLTFEMTAGSSKDRNWKADPWLSGEETLEPSDYKGAYEALGTDRGHLAPLGSFDGTDEWYEVNYLSNIVPQKSSLNRGPWKQLEDAVRDLLNTYREVYVMTGTYYEGGQMKLPGADEDATVPDGFWKIICVPLDETNFEAAAFMMPQIIEDGKAYTDYAVTIDEVERKTTFDFLWELEDSVEDERESQINMGWIQNVFISRN